MATNTSVRNKELRFYKDGDGGFADVAGHTQAQNRMVARADRLIERFAAIMDFARGVKFNPDLTIAELGFSRAVFRTGSADAREPLGEYMGLWLGQLNFYQWCQNMI